MFTWIPIHREAVAKLLELHRQGEEPLATLRAMEAAGLKVVDLNDENDRGKRVPLEDIDPFTFFANFNRGLTNERRRENWNFVRSRWGLKSAVPEDFTGIPTLHNMASRLFPSGKDRSPDHIPLLWSLAEQAVNGTIDSLAPALLDKCLALPRVSTSNLTIGLFWINPKSFLAADHRSVDLGRTRGIAAPNKDYASYRRWLGQMTQAFGPDYPAVSHAAYGMATDGAPDESAIPGNVMAHLWKRFHERITGFTDFETPGEDFIQHETAYKHDLLSRFAREGGRQRLQELVAKGAGLEAAKSIRRALNSNIASFHAWDPTLGRTDEDCCAALGPYLTATATAYAGPATTQPIFEAATRLKLKPAWDAVTLLLWALRPNDYFPVKISHFRDLAKENALPIPRGAINAEKLDEVLEFGRAFREVLAPQRPKDWVDVQSFIWVVCPDSYKQPHKDPEENLVPEPRNYWWLNANPKIWNFDDMPVGQRQSYTSHNEKKNKRQRYRWFQEARPGDLIVGYVATPQKEIVAICKVTKGLHEGEHGEEIEFEKVEHLAKPISYAELTANPELADSEPIRNNQGSLFRLTEDEFAVIRALIDSSEEELTPQPAVPYTVDDAMRGLFLDRNRFEDMLTALREKKNIVLQGAPGVGKTFIADRLAYALMSQEDDSRLTRIQFHQSYSYEDFIQGFRPTPKGTFELRYGVFHEFCRRAQRDPDPTRPWVFVIDEINRGNLSKIFGELMMLLEADKRGRKWAMPLAYAQNGDDRFFVPENVHVVGLMNTADRSLAMVDYALRRRFRFLTLEPEFDRPAFRDHLLAAGAKSDLTAKIVARMTELNRTIGDDVKNLGPGFRLGHSFFCPGSGSRPDEAWYRRVIESEIVPMLEEYWFDDPKKVATTRAALLE